VWNGPSNDDYPVKEYGTELGPLLSGAKKEASSSQLEAQVSGGLSDEQGLLLPASIRDSRSMPARWWPGKADKAGGQVRLVVR
jgi:hypothetical protein